MKRRHELVALAIVASTFAAACDEEPAPTEPATSARAKTKSSAAPPVSASAKKAASPSAPVAKEMASLPPGGMIYAKADLGLVDLVLGAMPDEEKDKALGALEEVLGEKVTDHASLAKALGLDGERSIWLAAVGPDAKGMLELTDSFIAAKTDEERDGVHKRMAALEPPPFVFVRVVVPVADAEAKKLLGSVEKMTKGKLERCPDGPMCKGFTAQPHSIFASREGAAALYLEDKTLTVDVVMAADHAGESDKPLAALAAFHGKRGGAGGERCGDLASAKGTGLCFVPELAAEAGVATGLMMTLGAVSAKSVDPKQKVEIAKMGKKESLQSRAILGFEPKVLDDGTFVIGGSAKALESKASWLVSADGEKLLAKSFAEEQCASSGKDVVELLEKLRAALGVDAKTEPKLWDQAQEAGWGAYPVMAGGAWPRYLPFLIEGAKEAPDLFTGKTCVHLDGKRLRIESKTDLVTALLR